MTSDAIEKKQLLYFKFCSILGWVACFSISLTVFAVSMIRTNMVDKKDNGNDVFLALFSALICVMSLCCVFEIGSKVFD